MLVRLHLRLVAVELFPQGKGKMSDLTARRRRSRRSGALVLLLSFTLLALLALLASFAPSFIRKRVRIGIERHSS
ncbi:MAG TPA: hypothetical protein VK459_15740 [Polyangiaceae bacterium]|nr:hypothetical protein [Polyangiaceae bacterium]